MLLATREIAVPLHLREKPGASYRNLSAPCVDTLCRELQVMVLHERCADEFLQLRVLEDLPPGKIRIRRCLSLDLCTSAQITEGRWGLHYRSVVVRAYHAASD